MQNGTGQALPSNHVMTETVVIIVVVESLLTIMSKKSALQRKQNVSAHKSIYYVAI